MPVYSYQQKTKKAKEVEKTWDGFRGGLNTLLRADEIKENEYAEGQNLVLEGSGALRVRDGYGLYYLSAPTGIVRSVKGVKFNGTGNSYVLSLTDWGYLTKRSGESYAMITGASFPSGCQLNMELIDDKVWLTSEDTTMGYWSEGNIVNYGTVQSPTITGISKYSANATGTYRQYYRITALTDAGETLGSLEGFATGCSMYPSDMTVQIGWSVPSAASGFITGYNIYGRESGDRMFYINRVNAYSSYFEDTGTNPPNYFQSVPLSNTTGGKKAKYLINHKGRLVVGNTDNGKCTIEWSGAGSNIGKFDWSVGGGYLTLNKNAGDEITGIYDAFDKIIVYFNRSIYTVDISQTLEYLGASIVVPKYQRMSDSIGCIGQKTIHQVENDIFFVSRRDGGGIALMVLGYEPNITSDLLRTNEISAKIRPIFKAIQVNQMEKIHCIYRDKKYYIAYPSSTEGECDRIISYDRERGAWNSPFNIQSSCTANVFDENNEEYFLLSATSSPKIYKMSETLNTDDGTNIRGYFRSKKEYFGDFRTLKELKEIFLKFNSVNGTVNIRVNCFNRDDELTIVKAVTITGGTIHNSTGFGYDLFGDVKFGDTSRESVESSIMELVRWMNINTVGRYFEIEIESTSGQTVWELGNISLRARQQSSGATVLESLI